MPSTPSSETQGQSVGSGGEGGESFEVRAKALFRPYFKTFVPPFLPI